MKRLMTHVVVGSPDMATTKRIIQQMVDREVAGIELQIPFSDPIADGPVLIEANDVAVKNGVSVSEMLSLLASIKPGQTKIYIMSYLQPILHFGPKTFFRRALEAGCSGFIIPDLPFDAGETRQFIQDCPEFKSLFVPVLSSGMQTERMDALFAKVDPKLVYLTARHGITGEHTAVTDNLATTIKSIRAHTSADIAVGFGIQNPDDVRAVLQHADLAVVGSALTQTLKQSEKQAEILLDRLCRVS
jgi:tryptophan synthase alpha chain